MDQGPNNPSILERDWQLIGSTLRRMISRTILKVEHDIDASHNLYATAEGLEKLAQASLHACYLDIAAASLEARVGREGKAF